jgi:hypothetical protein
MQHAFQCLPYDTVRVSLHKHQEPKAYFLHARHSPQRICEKIAGLLVQHHLTNV